MSISGIFLFQAEDLLDDEAEEAEEDESEEEEDDDEVEPGEVSNSAVADEEDDSDDDEAPAEEPVSKGKGTKKPGKSNTDESDEKTGIPKVRVGKIPSGTPKNTIIFATNLPKGTIKFPIFECGSCNKIVSFNLFLFHRLQTSGPGCLVFQIWTDFHSNSFAF